MTGTLRFTRPTDHCNSLTGTLRFTRPTDQGSPQDG